MNKELTNCQGPREHGLNICAVLMSRLLYFLWHHDIVLNLICLDPLTKGGVDIGMPRQKYSVGSVSPGCTSSGLSTAACQV